jgi:hypothetical protein
VQLIFRPVTNEIVVRQTALLDVMLEQDGRGLSLRTTDEHPFWVEGRGWMRADSLVPGSMVDTLGGPATVLALSFTGERTTVHNISVAGNPNYFVGPDGMWVHNCTPRLKFKGKRPTGVANRSVVYNSKTGEMRADEATDTTHGAVWPYDAKNDEFLVGDFANFDSNGKLSDVARASGTYPGTGETIGAFEAAAEKLLGQ